MKISRKKKLLFIISYTSIHEVQRLLRCVFYCRHSGDKNLVTDLVPEMTNFDQILHLLYDKLTCDSHYCITQCNICKTHLSQGVHII